MKKDRLIKSILTAAVSGVILITGVLSQAPMEVKADGELPVTVTSATIAGENVVVNAAAAAVPASDDGIYYLFAEKVYQAAPSGAAVATTAAGPAATFVFPLGYNTAANHLYDKFQVAVKQGGAIVPVSAGKYITNPEVLGGNAAPRKNNGKKGLILDSAKIGNGNTEAMQLGVQQAAYNINLEDVIGGNGQIAYPYNGKVYTFDSASVAQYDHCVVTATVQGMGMTMVLLNPRVKGEEFMIAPSARSGRCSYYMMNTQEEKGLEYLEAVVSFLANRYNGKNGCGQVDNWVVGNEVNAKNIWNYSSTSDQMAYAQQYADELRVCYNAIKSRNANAHVCVSLDQNWTKVQAVGSYYSARSTLEAINACIVSQGNIDWALAEHPYNYPMTWTSFWTPRSEEDLTMILHNIDTPYLSMQNIEVLTDYMSLPTMRNTKGNVRPILLTEIGYPSTQGEQAQAAAIVYAYQRAMTNRYIDMIIFNRQTDHQLEVSQGMPVGLTRQDGTPKLSYIYYQKMNGPEAQTYIQQAAAYMGITDWNAAMMAR